MYKKIAPNKTTLKINNSYEGETIEAKIRRVVTNKEPITDGAPLIYTERNKGIQPEYNIRTDKMEVALDAMTAVANKHVENRVARQKDRLGKMAQEGMKKEGEGKA